MICNVCSGDGWYADRDPSATREDDPPIQVQCCYCFGTGNLNDAEIKMEFVEELIEQWESIIKDEQTTALFQQLKDIINTTMENKPSLTESEKKEGWEIQWVNNCWMKVLPRDKLLAP